MNKYQQVPVSVAADVAGRFQKSIVVILCYDQVHAMTHVTTYGKSPGDKLIAADIGEKIAKMMNLDAAKRRTWEDFRQVDAAVRAKRIEDLYAIVSHLLSIADGVISSKEAVADVLKEARQALACWPLGYTTPIEPERRP